MCNGDRNYFKKTLVFDTEEQASRFISLYSDLFSESKASWMKGGKYWMSEYKNYYEGYIVMIFVTSENWEVIKSSGLFKKHVKSSRGCPVMKYVG